MERLEKPNVSCPEEHVGLWFQSEQKKNRKEDQVESGGNLMIIHQIQSPPNGEVRVFVRLRVWAHGAFYANGLWPTKLCLRLPLFFADHANPNESTEHDNHGDAELRVQRGHNEL